jgi:hypothetical protein
LYLPACCVIFPVIDKNGRTPEQALADLPAFFRPRDLDDTEFTRHQIPSLLRHGLIKRVERGLYRKADAPITVLETQLAVASLVPEGILCLLSALRYHELGTQSPSAVWMAIHYKARPPQVRHVRVRFVRWSGASMTYGVEMQTVQGVPLRLTSPSRTIVDCFRYRNKIGLDVALEALDDGLRSRKATVRIPAKWSGQSGGSGRVVSEQVARVGAKRGWR